MRSESEVNRAVERYADTVKRICKVYVKNDFDTKDVFQTVFLKYLLYPAAFENDEHEKAWIIRVTINVCKDWLKTAFRRRSAELEETAATAELDVQHGEVMDAVQSLPEKYKLIIYLHYYEGYTAPEIGRILHKNVNTVYTLLARAKAMLKEKLGGEQNA